ncbi:Na(+)-translocating NADH-quinone reductase subunit C [Pseudomonas leptonychotis]|uniref:Na(+)-translocating NADH-quinone reductase subunit C n=1 Tax=Pseudomonas leptonychotis TaxID=2448482 RepID=A0A4T1ZRU1_9PSED|nr:Na(+)-translocating NADH-quinone reductase subunit C [Pseudomonas leptonychotis]TIH06925.1 Na(+)-translocating NADH-quinone reductase subunit C [Pseudomonas leptonychotis]
MSSQKESTARTLVVALLVCLVCSVFVAGAAIALKPTQTDNRLLDKQRSILAIAGLGNPEMSGKEAKALFDERITAKIVDLETGTFSDAKDPIKYEPLQGAKDPSESIALTVEQDLAKLKRRERYTIVYLVQADGQLDKVVLPIRGQGLWSTLYGFVALKADLNTVSGFGFYQHGETPGLGGEIDNPKWKSLWPGKTIFAEDGNVAIAVVKGGVDPKSPKAVHQVDALAGATLTSNGVDQLMKFWMGEDGFAPFIAKLRAGEA